MEIPFFQVFKVIPAAAVSFLKLLLLLWEYLDFKLIILLDIRSLLLRYMLHL